MAPPLTRRELLRSSLAGGAAACAAGALASRLFAEEKGPGPDPAKHQLTVLVLGGTRFLGPAIVDYAVARGHTVTLFNRGKSNPEMYPDLEKLRGNRGGFDRRAGKEIPPDFASLRGRTWDVCIDTSGYWPEHVEASSKALAGAVKHYTFVSTISVYPGFGKSNERITEASSLGDLKPRSEYEGFQYGPFKALCEQAVERAMPGRVANVRPGLIVGPRDASDRFTWWPVRIKRGGEILAPGDGTSPCQFIDVRDLGGWLVRVAEQKTVGVYNATGFDKPYSLADLLEACRVITSSDGTITWVDEAFLEAQKVQPFMQMPLWIPKKGLPYVAVDKAIAKGLTFRPQANTVTDTLAWALHARPGGKLSPRVGLPAAREAEILAAWHAQNDK